MNIQSINFNTRINTYNTTTFGKQSDIARLKEVADVFAFEEFFNGKSKVGNNILLKMAIKKGNYKHAYEDILSRAGDNFNPNTYDKDTGYTLLAMLYKRKHLIKDITQDKYRKLLIAKIIYHPAFNPNDDFFLDNKISGEFKRLTYLEDAVRTNNIELLTYLCEHPHTEDPYKDDFDTIDSFSCNPHTKFLINRLKLKNILYSSDNSSVERTDTNENQAELYECDEVKPFRKEIKDEVPASLDEVGGLHKAKVDIHDFIIKPWAKDIRQKLIDNNIDLPNGFMMYGPPGCGKTYIVEVIAKETGFPMYEVDLASVGNSKAYETEKSLRLIFEKLESQYHKNNIPNILFLDEIDSICASRKDSGTDWKRDEINALISLLNNASKKGIIVIGATNLIDNVDPAVLRTGRFDKKIEVTLPTFEERKDILEKLISKKRIVLGLLNKVDELAKATDGKSCSDLAAIVNDCGRRAIYDSKKSVNTKDFEKSIEYVEAANKERELIGFHP